MNSSAEGARVNYDLIRVACNELAHTKLNNHSKLITEEKRMESAAEKLPDEHN
jgi:hypothetical protein